MLEVKFITINDVDVWYTTIKGHVLVILVMLLSRGCFTKKNRPNKLTAPHNNCFQVFLFQVSDKLCILS